MERISLNKGIILFYIISMVMTYLLVIRVESLNNVTNSDNSVVYLTSNS